MRTDLPTGRIALLLTDIEGSTRLLHRLGSPRYAQALETHRRLLRECFAAHQGVEVDTQGDAFFVAFPDSWNAVSAAVSAQQALAGHPWPEQDGIKVRIGVHTGTPRLTGEGYVGMDLHLAARIAACGHGGQVLLSQDTASDISERLDGSGHALRDLGPHRLKDVDTPLNLFQVVIQGLPSDFGRLRSQIENVPNNLPGYQTPFVGREKLISDLRDLVLEPTVRVVTLIGPGGSGKSRAGIRVAEELLYRFPDGGYFVPLAAVTRPDQVLPAIAVALGATEEGEATLFAGLTREIGDRQLLLVLDNFEQVQAASADIGRLLTACRQLKLIVTSRERLHISGERLVPIPPLEVPSAADEAHVEALVNCECVRLFADRARAVRENFKVHADNVSTIAEICRQVDGLPLAIELAAARIQTMEPDRLLRSLRRRLKVLTGGAADLHHHQRTLRDLIAWSYDLLTAEEQVLWRRLSVFAGGCTYDAAQAVCDVDDDLDIDIDVDPLVTKSLVTVDFSGGVSGPEKVISQQYEPRIGMLLTLRDFALEKLEAAGELDELRNRHCRYYLDIARQAREGIHGADVASWLARLDLERANMTEALEHGLPADPERAGQLAAALWFYWYERGWMTEGSQWLEKLLEHRQVLEKETEVRLLIGLTGICRQQGELIRAEAWGGEAVRLSQELQHEELTGTALGQLGAILQRQGRFEESVGVLEEAVALLQGGENRERLSFTLTALGAAFQLTDRIDDAESCYRQAVRLGRELNDRNAVATALVNLGEVAQLKGELPAARDFMRRSLAIYASIGMKIAIAYCLEVIAGLEIDLGEYGLPAVLLGHAEWLRETIDAPIESFNLPRYENDVDRLRSVLPALELERLWGEGAGLTTEECVARTLSITVDEIDETGVELMNVS